MTVAQKPDFLPHSAHWGVFSAAWQDEKLQVRAHPDDPEPNSILDNFPSALRHRARVTTPMVRRGWLERGPGADPARGLEPMVSLSWEDVLDRLARELARVQKQHGVEAIFGGSYGWSSAGRFHHAQSQIHRFLNTVLGGYVRSVNSYSAGASGVILPHVMGTMEQVARRNVTWEQIGEHTDVVLAFGGMALKNTRVASGGISQHIERAAMAASAQRGCRFLNISPLRSDLPDEAGFEWWPVVPGTDTALMLGLVHSLVQRGWHDRAFLDHFCEGWSVFEDYLQGRQDGVVKSAQWAAGICGMDAGRIEALAESLHGRRVLVTVAHSLQRSENGEQPVWMGAVLAAVLGQIGLPGGGYNYALGTLAHYGKRNNVVGITALPQGRNSVEAFIPVARITDMLLKPGQAFDYNGARRVYPHIRLAYWAGGNPYHHHQDLSRLTQGFRRLETLVVHESAWTHTARMADIVLPATMTLEREDIGGTPTDPMLVAMHRIAPPIGMARDDYDIFCDLATRLGGRAAFTEGRDSRAWLRYLYDSTRTSLVQKGHTLPDFDTFWQNGYQTLPQAPDDGGMLRAFREDPLAHPLPTPSGKLHIHSDTVASFGYADCPGHPAWLPRQEVPDARHPLFLIANQPATKLHSQLDFGAHCEASKRQGREVCTLHPQAAAERGIAEGDIVRLFNDRGACLASAHLSADMRSDVVQLPTGAWYDPVELPGLGTVCVHGNPNALTRDVGTSSLAQGCSGQLCAVQLERYSGELPPVRAFEPPC